MSTKKLTILGKNDIKITMILDNLESQKKYPLIEIINNLNEEIKHNFNNDNFKIKILKELSKKNGDLFLGVNNPKIKNKVYNHFNFDKNLYVNIINDKTSISSTTKIGFGNLINSLVSIASHSELHDFITINRNCSIGHHTTIKSFVTINPGANIAGFVNVEEQSWIGMGVNILDGINIGKNTIIGAGSLVTKDIPDNVIAYGSPCKIIRENV